MLAHTWLDFFLSTAPSALLLLLLRASSICRALAVLGLSCHSRLGSPGLPTCLHSLPRNPTSPQQSGSFPPVLPPGMLPACSEASRRTDALGISSPSDLSQPCYCTLARETWDANNVSRLRHGVRNQDTWLLSRFRCSPDRQLWGSPVKTPLFCVALLSPTHCCRIGEHSQAHVIPCRHRTWQLRKSRAGN